MLKACTECWKSISELNGYLKAEKETFSNDEIRLLHLGEAKNALEMEGYNIANIRVFEAYASENGLNEPTADLIFEMTNIAQNLKQINASALSLNFPFIQKSKKSNFQLPLLKKEINQYLNYSITNDSLLYLGLLYGYIAAQKSELKYRLLLANALINHWMKENNLLQLPILPLAQVIRPNLKEAEELLNESFETGAMQPWILYFLNVMQRAAQLRLEQLQNLVQLKNSTHVIITKYTLYHLPENELMKILFEKPFIKAKDIISVMDCHRQTAYAYLTHLEQAGILIEKKSGREKLYFHKKLFEVLTSG